MPKISKLARAKTDLAEIWDYIADDSEAQADAFIDRIDRKLVLLAENPTIGRMRDELAENMRSFPFDRYVIFYIATSNGIQIVRVLHGARDLATIFRDEA